MISPKNKLYKRSGCVRKINFNNTETDTKATNLISEDERRGSTQPLLSVDRSASLIFAVSFARSSDDIRPGPADYGSFCWQCQPLPSTRHNSKWQHTVQNAPPQWTRSERSNRMKKLPSVHVWTGRGITWTDLNIPCRSIDTVERGLCAEDARAGGISHSTHSSSSARAVISTESGLRTRESLRMISRRHVFG